MGLFNVLYKAAIIVIATAIIRDAIHQKQLESAKTSPKEPRYYPR